MSNTPKVAVLFLKYLAITRLAKYSCPRNCDCSEPRDHDGIVGIVDVACGLLNVTLSPSKTNVNCAKEGKFGEGDDELISNFNASGQLLIWDCPQLPLQKMANTSTVRKLQILNKLPHNWLLKLSETYLERFAGLRELDISWIVIKEFHINALLPLKKLTSLYLDNNSLRTLPKLPLTLTILGVENNNLTEPPLNLPNLTILLLRGNNLRVVPHLVGLPKLETLDLSENELHTISSDAFAALPELRFLSLRKNSIKVLPETLFDSNKRLHQFLNIGEIYNDSSPSLFKLLKKIQFKHSRLQFMHPRVQQLLLDHNQLSHLSNRLLEKLNGTEGVTLHANPWKCDCDAVDLLFFVRHRIANISDANLINCTDGRLLYQLAADEICPHNSKFALIVSFASVASSGVALATMAAVYYKFQHQIKVWLYTRNLLMCWVAEEDVDTDKKYDVFTSYSHRDENFVVTTLLPNLEPEFKFCIHARDWNAGDWIPEQIARSVEESRRTLVILSPFFLQSVWGRMEFRAAHQQALSEGRVRVVVILLEDVGPLDQLDSELSAYLSMNTYLKWGDPHFWDKLRYALPHRRLRGDQLKAPRPLAINIAEDIGMLQQQYN